MAVFTLAGLAEGTPGSHSGGAGPLAQRGCSESSRGGTAAICWTFPSLGTQHLPFTDSEGPSEMDTSIALTGATGGKKKRVGATGPDGQEAYPPHLCLHWPQPTRASQVSLPTWPHWYWLTTGFCDNFTSQAEADPDELALRNAHGVVPKPHHFADPLQMKWAGLGWLDRTSGCRWCVAAPFPCATTILPRAVSRSPFPGCFIAARSSIRVQVELKHLWWACRMQGVTLGSDCLHTMGTNHIRFTGCDTGNQTGAEAGLAVFGILRNQAFGVAVRTLGRPGGKTQCQSSGATTAAQFHPAEAAATQAVKQINSSSGDPPGYSPPLPRCLGLAGTGLHRAGTTDLSWLRGSLPPYTASLQQEHLPAHQLTGLVGCSAAWFTSGSLGCLLQN